MWRKSRAAVALPHLISRSRWCILGYAGGARFITKRDVNNRATLAQITLTVPTVVAHNLAVIVNRSKRSLASDPMGHTAGSSDS